MKPRNPHLRPLTIAGIVAFIAAMLLIAVVAPPRENAQPTVETAVFEAFDTPGKSESAEENDKEDEAKEEVKTKAKTPAKASKKKAKKAEKWKSAVLQVVTNFDKADVTVNGIQYPEYVDPGGEKGMVLPAGGPYQVLVTYDGKVKTYKLHLRPYETRLLIVELTGFMGGGAAAKPVEVEKPKKEQKKKTEKKEKDEKEPGKVTVYSKPPGTIMVDGAKKGEKTPGTVEVENGRHEVQVEYESGEVSEKKIVRVRQGSRIKLFFRERKK